MDWRALAAAALVLAPSLTLSGGPFTSLHPEEAYPDPAIPADFDPYAGLVSEVQRKLRGLGFDAGPVNGDFGAKTQAALAQFQLSTVIPASGQLDERTLAELGIERSEYAGAGGSSP
jgi:peptidoglycan hydrolase-like protein with peptidoglycan-binding domain